MEHKWYMVQAQSNREKKAVELLKNKIEQKSKQADFEEIVVPEQEKPKLVRGKKQMVKERVFPGYILMRMVMTPENMSLVMSTQYISNFVSTVPITDKEAEAMLNRLQTSGYSADENMGILVGDHVQITSGPFATFSGKVESADRGKLKVMVSIFGRPTPVEIPASEVIPIEKVESE